MTPDQALERLVFHSGSDEGSFLEMLRPFRGLREEILADVLTALRACGPKVNADVLSRELVGSLWAISRLGRSWALDPGGMLRRNDLINAADQKRLWDFFDEFDYDVMTMLEGGAPASAT
jgi:hypothetical protein